MLKRYHSSENLIHGISECIRNQYDCLYARFSRSSLNMPQKRKRNLRSFRKLFLRKLLFLT